MDWKRFQNTVKKMLTQKLPNCSNSKVYIGQGIEQIVFTFNGLWIKVRS